MEFHYRVDPAKKHFYWLKPVLLIILIVVLHLFIDRTGIADLIWNLIWFGYLGLLIIGYRTFRFYKESVNTVVRLDDNSISLEQQGIIKSIRWDEVDKVTWGPSSKKTGFTSIIIKAENNKIIVGGKIDGFPEIIQFVKAKVGGKFITYDVPWELKYPKTDKLV